MKSGTLHGLVSPLMTGPIMCPHLCGLKCFSTLRIKAQLNGNLKYVLELLGYVISGV